MERPMTPEEVRWRASACNPEKIKRNLKLQYILLGCLSVLTLGLVVLICLNREIPGWASIIALVCGFISVVLGIVNNKRVLAGKKPWGDI